jgi:hypothetical protein
VRNITKGRDSNTGAQWQLALVYAHCLSPDFYIWCNELVHNAMQRFGGPDVGPAKPTSMLFEEAFGDIHRRIDVLAQYIPRSGQNPKIHG